MHSPPLVLDELAAAEEDAILASLEPGADPDVVLAWALRARCEASMLDLAIAGRLCITVIDGEPQFVLPDREYAAVEELLVEWGGSW